MPTGYRRKGQQLILDIYDTATRKVAAQTATNANEKQLKNFITPKVGKGSIIYTNEWRSYNFLTKAGVDILG